jgi:hypothetical protein
LVEFPKNQLDKRLRFSAEAKPNRNTTNAISSQGPSKGIPSKNAELDAGTTKLATSKAIAKIRKTLASDLIDFI